jgi:hypothetical protein
LLGRSPVSLLHTTHSKKFNKSTHSFETQFIDGRQPRAHLGGTRIGLSETFAWTCTLLHIDFRSQISCDENVETASVDGRLSENVKRRTIHVDVSCLLARTLKIRRCCPVCFYFSRVMSNVNRSQLIFGGSMLSSCCRTLFTSHTAHSKRRKITRCGVSSHGVGKIRETIDNFIIFNSCFFDCIYLPLKKQCCNCMRIFFISR